MASAWIEGKDLHVVIGDKAIPADRIMVEAAPDQPGTLLFARHGSDGVICIYLDKDGEPCDVPTVEYFAQKAKQLEGKDN